MTSSGLFPEIFVSSPSVLFQTIRCQYFVTADHRQHSHPRNLRIEPEHDVVASRSCSMKRLLAPTVTNDELDNGGERSLNFCLVQLVVQMRTDTSHVPMWMV